MSIVNRAYAIEIGNTGLAFKYTPRYRYAVPSSLDTFLLDTCAPDIPHTWIGYLKEDGRVVCSGKAEIDKIKDSVSLGPLAVDPDYQGKGYGRVLLEFLEGLAKHQELYCVSCRTDVKTMYEKRGYVVTQSNPVTEFIPSDRLTRKDLQMMKMVKLNK